MKGFARRNGKKNYSFIKMMQKTQVTWLRKITKTEKRRKETKKKVRDR